MTKMRHLILSAVLCSLFLPATWGQIWVHSPTPGVSPSRDSHYSDLDSFGPPFTLTSVDLFGDSSVTGLFPRHRAEDKERDADFELPGRVQEVAARRGASMPKSRSRLAVLAGITAGTILLLNGAAVSVFSPTPQEATVERSEGRRVVTIHPSLAASRIKRRSEPVYPDAVQAAGISGAVLLDVTVDEQGAVETVQPLTGYPVLLDAAADTIRNWRYLPFSQDGVAVAFKATLTVNFLMTDDDTPHLWLSVDGAIGKQGSKKSLSQEDLGRLFQKSPTAVISHSRDISFATLDNSVRRLSELGLQRPQISFFTFDDGTLYYVTRNPGVPEGPEISLESIPGASAPKDGQSASGIFQVFVSAEGQATKVLRITGPPRPETEEALKALKLERPVMWQSEAVPATFYVQAY